MLTRLLRDRPRLLRLLRYVVTSGVSTVASELTLLGLYATGTSGAVLAAILANLAGAIPSYLMSRYWIWPEGDRRRAGRQMVMYWVVSMIGLGLSTLVTGEVAAHTTGRGAGHDAVIGGAYLATYAALWIGKYFIYQYLLFRRPAEDGQASRWRSRPAA